MYLRQHIALLLSALVVSVAASASRAADVLQNVPPDALGFVVVHNASDTDAKVQRLLASLKTDVVGPLAFLENVIGISAGLDQQADYMLVAIPGLADAGKPDFCVWLPVSNYEALVTSLGSKPSPGVTAVTIAGEDLLIAQHGDWAVVMDPEQRSRMELLLAAPPAPPAQVAAWKKWIESNNVTVVALASGVRALLEWAPQSDVGSNLNSKIKPLSDDDLFGAVEEDPFAAAPSRRAPPNDIPTMVRTEVNKWISASPDLQRWAMLTTAVGCGVRLDADGNVLVGARVAVADNLFDEQPDHDATLPPALNQGGEFIVDGAARWTRFVAAPLASALVRQMANDLTNEERLKVDEENVAALQKAAERAAADTTSIHVYARPGEDKDGVYTNNFLVVRTGSTADFVEHAGQVMQAWNKMNLDAEGETRFEFTHEEVKLGDRTARKYSLDLLAADNIPPLPEIRQSMEKFFGPGGKIQLWIVPVDDKTALLASGTPEQVTAALDVINRKAPLDWNRSELAGVNRFLPEQSPARVFFSPSGYNRWMRRLMDAMVGTTVIGGPLVKEFPASPPIGMAAGADEHNLWIDIAVPAKTIEAAGPYFKSRPRIRLQR